MPITGYSTSQQVTERYVFSESAGALTMEQVKELPSMDELVLSNRYAVDAAMTGKRRRDSGRKRESITAHNGLKLRSKEKGDDGPARDGLWKDS